MTAGRNQLAAELMQWCDHYGFESGGDAQGVADELLGSAWLRAVKAEALRKAAHALQVNTWMDLFEGDLPSKIGNSQNVVDWLRERADVIEKGVDDE